MGEAKRRKAILGSRYGRIETSKRSQNLTFSSPEDHVAFGLKYFPPDIIQDAITFSWAVQFDPVPENYRVWKVRGLDELLWNPVSSDWLVAAARSPFYQKLLAGQQMNEILTILAKSLALVVLKCSPDEDDES